MIEYRPQYPELAEFTRLIDEARPLLEGTIDWPPHLTTWSEKACFVLGLYNGLKYQPGFVSFGLYEADKLVGIEWGMINGDTLFLMVAVWGLGSDNTKAWWSHPERYDDIVRAAQSAGASKTVIITKRDGPVVNEVLRVLGRTPALDTGLTCPEGFNVYQFPNRPTV